MASFDPHISLAYATEFTDEAAAKATLQEMDFENRLKRMDISSQLTQVLLMDTRSCGDPPSNDTPASWHPCRMPDKLLETLEVFRAQQ